MNRKRYRRFLWMFLATAILISCACYLRYVDEKVPDTIYLDSFSGGKIDINIPLIGTVSAKDQNGDTVEASVNLLNPLEIQSGQIEKYTLEIKFLGIIKVKNVTVSVNEAQKVIAGGIPVGIYIKTNGILVVDVGQVTTAYGIIEAPSKGILQTGDYVEKVNGIAVNSKEELVNLINEYGRDYVELEINRDGENMNVKLLPVLDKDNNYKIGVWVRDDCQGLGTLTYVDMNGNFGTLGHAISDSDTGEIVDIRTGSLYTARIWSLVKGEEGSPGEVIGSINYGDENYLGEIDANSEIGVYGHVDDNIYAFSGNEVLTVAYKQDIIKGTAYVRTFVEGKIRDYEISIDEVNYSDESVNKGIVFHVTDEKLLNATNGIIQGMSGSPIIQNGKFIGAVTHVFVKDPTKGYGIFAETMLEQK